MEGEGTGNRLFEVYWMHVYFKIAEALSSIFFFFTTLSLSSCVSIYVGCTVGLIMPWLYMTFLLQFFSI